MLVALAGCVQDSTLSKEQAFEAVKSINAELGRNIAQLDDDIRTGRTALVEITSMKYLSLDTANEVHTFFKVADYFMAKAWSSLIEGNLEDSGSFLAIGRATFNEGLAIANKELNDHEKKQEGTQS